LSVLQGLTKALARGAVEVIYLEVSSELLRRYGIGPEQVVEFLSNNSFRVFYCRGRDLRGRQPTRVRFTRHGLNRLRLAEFELTDDHLQTDLLAIHAAWTEKAES